MDEIYIGLIIVVGVIFTIRTINTYHNYKITIYPQIYSGFIEFVYRKPSLKRLSMSSWLEQNFGFHRILYYVDKTSHKRFKKMFVVIILSSGIYIINSKNLKGKIYLDKSRKYKFITSFVNKETKEYGNKAIDLPDPIIETESFSKTVSRVTGINYINKIIQFLDDTKIEIHDTQIPIICSKEFLTTIESLHKQSREHLNETEIERIYSQLHNQFYKEG